MENALKSTKSRSKTEILHRLTRQVRGLERAGAYESNAQKNTPGISSGVADLDALLPAQGYSPGSIVEYLASPMGGGAVQGQTAGTKQTVATTRSQATVRSKAKWSSSKRGHFAKTSGLKNLSSFGNGCQTLALSAASHAARDGRYVVIVDPSQQFYPPAAVAWGLEISQLIFVHPRSLADQIWAIDQALRCSAVGAVVAELGPLDDRDARRFQLAAEAGKSLGLFMRPDMGRSLPSWAEVQWRVSPRPCPMVTRSNMTGHMVAESRKNELLAGGNARAIRNHSPIQNQAAVASQLANQSPAQVDPLRPVWSWENCRWLTVELLRCRSQTQANFACDRRIGQTIDLVIDGYSREIYNAAAHPFATPHFAAAHRIDRHPASAKSHHVVATSTLHLASELAMPTRRSESARTHQPAVRPASA